MHAASKLRLLAPLLIRNRRELFDRIRTYITARTDELFRQRGRYELRDFDYAVSALEDYFPGSIRGALTEPHLSELDSILSVGLAELKDHAPFRLSHNAHITLARLCYAICRVSRPRTVVETGVGYGLSSCFILAALEANGYGELHSIDLPPLAPAADAYVGCLIPDELRGRWRLHRGSSRRLLQPLAKRLGNIDVFLHDSLHTFGHIRWELNTVMPHLSRESVVVIDDIDENEAFNELVRRLEPSTWGAVRKGNTSSAFGFIALPRSTPHETPSSFARGIDPR
jgi:predicted O-methyltransferase YrrM